MVLAHQFRRTRRSLPSAPRFQAETGSGCRGDPKTVELTRGAIGPPISSEMSARQPGSEIRADLTYCLHYQADAMYENPLAMLPASGIDRECTGFDSQVFDGEEFPGAGPPGDRPWSMIEATPVQ